mmetsp:Transcript_3700/g.17031  ORF Transcript_3700/g.17031 Transcript_3700/m.17031 type:complete len:89 (+) Transcript_3700:2587-2853(+)
MDFKERFMIANYHLDGYNNANIARLVKRSERGVANIINRFVETGQLRPEALNDASRPPLLQLLLYLKVTEIFYFRTENHIYLLIYNNT